MNRFGCLATLGIFSSALTVSANAAEVGNIDCGDSEYFKPFEFIENSSGSGAPNGTNVGIIADGYFIVIFAPDSGRPPGEIGVYDISNPREAREVKHLRTVDTEHFREAHSLPVAIDGDKEYAAVQTLEGIQIWDISDPLKLARYSSLDLPGIDGGDYDNVAWQATWQGQYLYVSGSNQGIYIVDTSDLKNPKLLEQVSNSKTGGFRVGPLFALGDYLVISNMDQDASLGVLDITTPDEPTLLGQKSGLPRLYTTLANADRIYGAGRDGVVTIHSISDPTEITEVKTHTIGQDSLYVAYQDGAMFSGRQDNFVKIDLSNENEPKIVGEGTLGRDHPDHGQVTPFGNLVYIGNDHGTGSAFFCHQRGRDTKPPAIEKISPADGSLGVAKTSRVMVAFSDYIDTRTINSDNITIRPVGGDALEGVYTFTFNTLSFGAKQPLAADQTYEIVLAKAGVKDVMGNGLAEQTIARFSTGDALNIDPPNPASGGSAGQSGSGPSRGGGLGTGLGGSPGNIGGKSAVNGSAGAKWTPANSNSDDDSSVEGSCNCGVPASSTHLPNLAQGLMAAALLLMRRRFSRRS